MYTYGIIIVVATLLAVHIGLVKLFKETAKPKQKPSIPRSKWI